MPKKKKAEGGFSDTGETQQTRFIEIARQLGCDEDDAAFDKKLKVIARQKPKEEPIQPLPKSQKAL